MQSTLDEWQAKDFEDFIAKKGSGVVEFGAPWCGACKASEPQIASLVGDYEKMVFAKIDVGKNSPLAAKMGVMSLPNVIIFKEGRVKEQMIGAVTAKVLGAKLAKI